MRMDKNKYIAFRFPNIRKTNLYKILFHIDCHYYTKENELLEEKAITFEKKLINIKTKNIQKKN